MLRRASHRLVSLLVVLTLSGCGGAETVGTSGTAATDRAAAEPAAPATTPVTAAAGPESEELPPGFLPSSDLRPAELATFEDFAIYTLGIAFEGLPLVYILREKESHLVVPIDPSTRVEIDRIVLIYGTCDAGASGRCAAPLNVDITPACRVNPSMYDGPEDAQPLAKPTVRGVPANDFGDSLELYTGDVTIQLHAEPRLAARAAEALMPANDLARNAVAAVTRPGELPPPAPGALAGTIAC